jgi:hypothetical protein
VSKNPNSAQAHLVLAYQYLTAEHADAALQQLRIVSTLQPKDSLTPQLIQQLEHKENVAAAGSGATQPAGATNAATAAAQPQPAAPAGKEGKLEGTWTAQPSSDTKITLSFESAGRFTWRVDRQGKAQTFAGKLSHENGILTLVQDQNSITMVGNVQWSDETHFIFKIVGGGAGDPGLSFTKAT